jgi:type II secretory pathway pseudopilin PulG
MSRTENCRRSERGFTLAQLLVVLAVIMIFVTATVPQQWSMVMARERDAQTIFIMKQYARSIRNFQLKHGTAPVSLQQLKDARSPRMMRGSGEWIDPLTGEVDWIVISASEARPGTTTPPGVTPQPQPPPDFRSVRPNPPPPSNPPPAGGRDGQPGGQIGPIAGVRPNKTGKSFLALNGAETYEEWRYTVQDLETEITGRRAALAVK